MRRLLIGSYFLVIAYCYMFLLSGCGLLNSKLSNEVETYAIETYSEDRKTEVLEKEGLSESSLNLYQQSVVESALSIFNYIDYKYPNNNFKYICITPSELLNGNTATLEVQSEYGVVKAKRSYNGEKFEFSDNYDEVKAGYSAKVDVEEFLSEYIQKGYFFVKVYPTNGSNESKWGTCGSIYFYADGSSISVDDFKEYIQVLEDFSKKLPVHYEVFGYLTVDRNTLSYYMLDTKGNYDSRDFILEYSFKEYSTKN